MRYELAGQKFGRLTVIKSTNIKPSRAWLCRCDCGQVRTVCTNYLVTGHTKSCGCLRAEVTKARVTKHGHLKRGQWTKEYRAWRDAKARCFIPSCTHFQNYGGRGITMTPKWRNNFAAFLAYLGPCVKGATLERIDVNGNYEPGNVCWIRSRFQARNRRNNHLVTFNGTTQCVAAWAEELGVTPKQLGARLRLGWSVSRAFTQPYRHRHAL